MKSIAFIGAGNMARAIIAGMCKAGFPAEKIQVSNRSQEKLNALQEAYGIVAKKDNASAVQNADLVVLSVKPAQCISVLEEVKGALSSSTLLVSIAAGMTIETLSKVSESQRWVRVMPNTPAQVGQGLFLYCHKIALASAEQKRLQEVFSVVGTLFPVVNEDQLDQGTAISGCGPAYFYAFMRSVFQAAQNMGFSKDQAFDLVLKTARGAVEVVATNQDQSLDQLCREVAAPGGATEQALLHFQSENLDHLVEGAIDQAYRKTKELAASYTK